MNPTTTPAPNRRVLIVDDNRAIHDDFRKILTARPKSRLGAAAADLFCEPTPAEHLTAPEFELTSVFQGREALEVATAASTAGQPFAMAFLDVRMPPGWDGIETAERIWAVDPDLHLVLCTAYSDYSWDSMRQRLGTSDRLVILKKPFDNVEVLQLATALTAKWDLLQQTRRHVVDLETTVRLRTEELRKSEERYRLITENAGDLVVLIDAQGRLIFHSPSFARELGLSAAKIETTSLFDLVHPEERAAFQAAIGECLQRGRAHVREFRARRGDGGWLALESNGAPFRDASGVVTSVLIIARDITERRRLELQLRQAQKLESIGQLASGIAHEINTPTQFIGDNVRFVRDGFIQFAGVLGAYRRLRSALQNGEPPAELLAAVCAAETAAEADYLVEEIPKALAQTLDGVQRTTLIVRAMKEFSHPGGADLEEIDLNHAVDGALTISRHEWHQVAELVCELDPELPPVAGRPGELNLVLLNLIINAAHAVGEREMDRGRLGRITVTTRRDGDWAEVRIGDTGSGIPDDIRERIFDPFFSTKPVGRGTGQGLAIARSVVVERHGGTIAFETEIGQGTVFIVRLPLPPSSKGARVSLSPEAASTP